MLLNILVETKNQIWSYAAGIPFRQDISMQSGFDLVVEHQTLSSKMCMFESNSHTISHEPISDFFIASLDGDWADADLHYGN